ncbi:hypothetical protein [Candidatus Nitrotoga arctica]|uniref:Uncharacterized protein n=1 Tax=Candidatus Nitrotoga arctica TaxID=453162 RepID=A0ABN8APQ6_9PROT|nr:hypothetical protein [Candidatus Nitrotoga arctica]CAG9932410.1 conserved protein of unknown function [Candidatus Nitrotoga arctica]
MFEHVVLRRAEGGLPISAGRIAETLLYYQKVQLFIDRETLFNLIQQIGTGRILTLLHRTDVSAVYCEEMLATQTESAGVSQYHNFITTRLAGHENVGKLKTPAERLQYELERQSIPKAEAKRFSKAFLELVPIRKFSGNHFLQNGITLAAKSDVLDTKYAAQAMRQAIALTPGGYVIGDDMKFEVIDSVIGLYVFTNIDLNSINRERSKFVPPLDPLTIAYLLNNILNARADLALASFYGGDFVTSAVTSSIIQLRHAELLRRSKLNVDSRRKFTEVILPDSPSVAEVIDSGERSFDEFLSLLDRAARFKDWLKAVNPDEDLIRTYMRDVSSEGWIQRLPVKSLRYVLTLALDATNPVVGLASGFLDNFIVEKLLSGWRPNHFVSGKLSPFLQGH